MFVNTAIQTELFTVLISRLNKWSLRSCVIVKSKHAMKTCSSRRFQWYPTTYMCWAMTKPLLWIRLILSHSKGWAGLNTYRLWGIIGIVLMSTFLIHAYFIRSREFAKPRLFSREISTVSCVYSLCHSSGYAILLKGFWKNICRCTRNMSTWVTKVR